MAGASVVAAGALHVASLVLGAAANSLALLAFYRKRRRVALSDRFVVNLLWGGLVTALTLPPLALAELAGAGSGGAGGGAGTGAANGLCEAGEAAAALAASLPPLAVLLLAGDQALAVLQPLRYRARLDTPRAAGLMLCGWALALAFGAASALAPQSAASLWRSCRCPVDVPSCCSLDDSSGYRAALAGCGFALLFALPFTATALIYARISGAARRNSQQAAPGGGCGAPTSAPALLAAPARPSLVTSIRSRLSNASALGRRPESRAARVSALVVLLALCCWLPWHALALARALAPPPPPGAGGGGGAGPGATRWADAAVLALLGAASPLAPALFAFRSRRVRRELRRLLRLPAASAAASAPGTPPRRPLLCAPPLPPPSQPPTLLLGPGAPLLPVADATGAPRGSFSSGASTQGTTSTEE